MDRETLSGALQGNEPEQESGENAEAKQKPAGKPKRSRKAGELYFKQQKAFISLEQAYSGLLRPSDSLIAAFFVPIVLLLLIFAIKGIFPFGSESFLRTDMYHQYAPFFSEFRHKLTTGGSLFYSWNLGMGVNFAALYAYYLASPLNWLLILCPKAYMIEFMTMLVLLKTGLCGLTMTWYLKKHESFSQALDAGAAEHRSERFGSCYFGIFYALSGYMAAYSWNIMWLDCIFLFPLIVLGLEKLVREGKGLLYCITLGLSILSNYYISILICMFMVLYMLCLLILEEKKSASGLLRSALRFVLYSLLAGGLAACVLLPEIAALQSTASGKVTFPKTIEQYFPILDMLARHIGCVQTETGLEHWPNLYCGVAVYLFFVLYLMCRQIPAKEKAVYCGLLLFLLASFSINLLNFIWHGFHYPNSLPCRQSFIYIFLVLTVCFRAYQYLEEVSRRQLAAALAVSIGFVLLAQKNLAQDEAYHFMVFYGAILFLCLYFWLISFYRNPRRQAVAAALLALSVVALESGLNMAVTSIITTSRTSYVSDNQTIRHQTEQLLEKQKELGGFFRFDRNGARTKNDGAWMNFPSVSLFSSLAHAEMTEFFKKMGCEGSTNAYSIVGSTPVIDSLFSVRYSLYNGEQENPRLIPVSSEEGIYLYENPCTLPVGFLLPDLAENVWDRERGTPADVQNHLNELLEVAPAFEYTCGNSSGSSFSFTAERAGEYYIAVTNQKIKTVSLQIRGEKQTIKNVNRGFLLETGYLKEGDTVALELEEGGEVLEASVYCFCMEGLQGLYEVLNQHPFQTAEWEDTRLSGTIEAGEGGTLFLSIPYDEGWSLTVDGEKIKTRKIWETFLGAELSAGSHRITLSYAPKGLKAGMLLSAVSLSALLAAFSVSCRRKREEKRKRQGKKRRHRFRLTED